MTTGNASAFRPMTKDLRAAFGREARSTGPGRKVMRGRLPCRRIRGETFPRRSGATTRGSVSSRCEQVRDADRPWPPEAVRASLEAVTSPAAGKTEGSSLRCRESRSNEDAANCIVIPTKVTTAALAVAMVTGAGAPTVGGVSASPPGRTRAVRSDWRRGRHEHRSSVGPAVEQHKSSARLEAARPLRAAAGLRVPDECLAEVIPEGRFDGDSCRAELLRAIWPR
jgi:hypothetical protein